MKFFFSLKPMLIATCFMVVLTTNAQDKIQPKEIITGVFLGETAPLRDLPVLTKDEVELLKNRALAKAARKVLKPREYPFSSTALPKSDDPVWQKTLEKNPASSAPIVNFEGQTTTSFPPDCNGTAGPNHYMQTVNVTYAIYDKTGTILAGPTALNTLFTGVPGATSNDGDPIVLYDEQADRWLVAEFTINLSNDYMLVAVSTTNDPTGTWYKYSFDVTNDPDYPKFGVWSDGYYMGINSTSGSDIYVFEKAKMLLGQTAQMVGFDNAWRPGSGFLCVPPLDNNGPSAPVGNPGMFIAFNDDAIAGGTDQLWLYELDVNWSNVASSTFTRSQQLNVAAFDSQFDANWDDITQPNSQKLDGVPQVIMNAPQYRNFGSYESIVCCHTVDVDATNHAGIRWYELRRSSPSTSWTIRQQGTFAPDQHSRWMGSIMLNGSGKIALGYSIASSTIYPGIRYTGQSSSAYANATGLFDIEEQIIHNGTVAQTTYNRWGDYALMSVDPTDDQTFWFSTEYVRSGGTTKGTKIASFKFGNDPTVATLPVSNLTGTTVTLNGSVNPNGLATSYVFQWGTTIDFGNTTVSTSAGSGNTVANVNASLNGLTPGQTYYYRISATNTDGTSNGETLSFVPGGVVLTTTAASNITTNEATSGGNITENGGSPVTARGVCWSTSENPTVGTNNFTTDGQSSGSFSSTITGLNSSTTYYVKAYATNANGTFYGNQISFTTLCGVFSLPINESFATTTLPNCWEITDQVGAGQIWKIGTITGYTPNPSLTGYYAYINSDGYGSGNSQNSDLLTPVMDLTNFTNINLSFSHYFRQYLSTSTASLYYSINGGSSWVLIQSWTASTSNPLSFNQTIAALSGQSQVRFRWNFVGTYAYYWAVDNIQITGSTSSTTLAVSPSNRDVTSAAGSTTFDITSNTNWAVESDQVWCSVTPSGSSNGTLTATYTENTSASSRVATLTVSATGVSPVLVTVTQAGVTSTPTAQIILRPEQIDLSSLTSKSAVLVNVNNYSTNDVRYRLYNGSNQYNCWDGTQFVTSSTYSANPSVPGSPTSDVTWWIMFERGSNNATAASYRDRLGPDYSANNLTIALPAASAVTSPFTINGTLPFSAIYPLDQRYIVLAYDAETAGNLIVATSSEITNGTYSLVLSDISVVRRIEVRNILNVLMESVTGTWQASNAPQIFTFSGGGSYCSTSSPSGITATLSSSEPGVSYQLLRNESASGNAVSGTGNPLVWSDLTEGSYTVTATNATATINMNGTAFVAVEQALSVSVTISPDQLSVCQGNAMTFTASPTNGGTNPIYTWTVNGLNAGSNNPSFSYTPVNGDIVSLSMTSSLTCVSDNPAISNSIQTSVSPTVQAAVSISSNTNMVCQGSLVEFTATPVNGGASPVFQWLVNGIATGSNNPSFSYAPDNGDIVSLNMTSSLTCVSDNPAISNSIQTSVSPTVQAAVSISSNTNSVCQGSLVEFTATPVNGGASPVFQWLVNGIATGSNIPSFSYGPANGDIVSLSMTSSLTCVSDNPVISNSIQTSVSPTVQAVVSISSNANSVCQGTLVEFTATPVNGGTSPVFQWLVNGIATVSTSPLFSYVPSDGDLVSVTMTSAAECVAINPVSSSAVTMLVIPSATVLVSILPDANPVCAGSLVNFTASAINAGTNPSYQWMINGSFMNGNAATFSYIPTQGDLVEATLTSNVICSLNNPAQSNLVTMQVLSVAPASVSLSANSTTLCQGEQAFLTASPVNGGNNPIFIWTVNGTAVGENSNSFNYVPQNGDLVSVAMTSSLNCVTGSPSLSNELIFSVNPPSVSVAANPANAGTATVSGTVALNQTVHLLASPLEGWNFENWTNNSGNVVSVSSETDFLVQQCENELTANFTPGNSIAGKLLFFNPLESEVPSPYNGGAFYVQLYDDATPVGNPLMVNQGVPFVFNALVSGKQYNLRLWDQPDVNLTGNSWGWNNWGGVSALDALIINYMATENPIVQNFPWIASASAPQATNFAFDLADPNSSNSLTALDALLLMYRSVGYPGTSPFPGGKHDFLAFASPTSNLNTPTYPIAPQIPFQRFGSYSQSSPANSVYQIANLPAITPGENFFKVFLSPTGDVNASFVPQSEMKNSTILAYDKTSEVSIGEDIEILIKANENYNFGAFNIHIKGNPELIEFLQVRDYPIAHINKTSNVISVAWMDEFGKVFLKGETILSINALVKSKIRANQDVIKIESGTEWGDVDALDIADVSLITNRIVTNDNQHEELSTFKIFNSPNPFQTYTTLTINIKEVSDIYLVIQNSLGMKVNDQSFVQTPEGSVQIKVEKDQLTGPGLYTYQLSVIDSKGKHQMNGKIILLK